MKKILSRTLLLALLAAGYFFAARSTAHAEMTCAEHTHVSIDVKPADALNKINLSAQGLVPVAVLGTEAFDAGGFAPEMAHLNDAGADMSQGCHGAAAVRWKLDDVNRDGRTDLVFFFSTQDLPFTSSTTEAMLMAHGSYGGSTIHIMGADAVVVKQ